MAVAKKKIQPPKRLQYSEKYAKRLRQPRNHFVMVYMNVDEYGALKEHAGSVPMGRFVREIVMRSLSRKKRGV